MRTILRQRFSKNVLILHGFINIWLIFTLVIPNPLESAVPLPTVNLSSDSFEVTYGISKATKSLKYNSGNGELILEHVNRNAPAILVLIHGQHSMDESSLNTKQHTKERWTNLLQAMRKDSLYRIFGKRAKSVLIRL